MQGNKAAMIFTDPPYNVDYKGGMGTFSKNEREGILNDKMSKEDFYTFLYNFLNNALSVCDGGVYICMSSTELDTLKKSFEAAGGHFQSFIIKETKLNYYLANSIHFENRKAVSFGQIFSIPKGCVLKIKHLKK